MEDGFSGSETDYRPVIMKLKQPRTEVIELCLKFVTTLPVGSNEKGLRFESCYLLLNRDGGGWGTSIFPTDVPLVTVKKPRHLGQTWGRVGDCVNKYNSSDELLTFFLSHGKSLKCSKKNNSKSNI